MTPTEAIERIRAIMDDYDKDSAERKHTPHWYLGMIEGILEMTE